ncbi:MAG: site-specific integrase [Rhodoferax sp.]|jgi:integrase|uniref:site-specific integrase n=1 Tax=Rhodoferax sp. TaxID=50421 RepID=UPI001B4C77A2|nr:site-specific integrase [Rhodoferax sp.]MBP8285873.1 site-specific integrase [Rhodoferax sp.]MBP9734302.1 site-specific integrase [Rhodoferax sp.]
MQGAIVSIERSTIAKAAQAKDKPARPIEIRSDRVLGLLLRIQPSGSRTFYVQVKRGQRVKIGPAGTYTLKQAEERAKAILRDPDAALKCSVSAQTLDEYITNHYTDHALAKLKNGQKSIDRVRAIWKSLLSKRLTDIKATDIDKHRDKRVNAGVTPATVNRDVSALSGVLAHWAKSTGSEHPLAGFEVLRVADDEVVRYLTPDESKRLRQALADRDESASAARVSANQWRSDRGRELLPVISGFCDHMTPMVLLSLNTGMRQGELFSLAWESVDLSLKTITVLASHSKGNNTRVIPINTEALAVLTTIKPNPAKGLVFKSPVTGGRFNNVKKAWAEITKAAGVPDLRWHDLRHDFASQLVMKGAPLFTVQKLLGHANSRMTQRYAKLAPSTLSDAVNLL